MTERIPPPLDLESYYEAVASGDRVDPGLVLQYVKSFKHVVLWGASFLGRAIGEYLLRQGVKVSAYWDLRSNDIESLNGISVAQPFTGAYDRTTTLIILCIGNVVITPPLLARLASEGYPHVKGDYFFMGAICPFDKESGVSPEVCIRSMACRYIYCRRLGNISRSAALALRPAQADGPLFFGSVTLVINSVCSLSCRFCTSYMPSYPARRRRNFPLARILEDIRQVFSAVDGIGSVSIMGGEPFLHPDIAAIALAVLAQKNCTGLISIATSGIARITEKHLAGLDDPRLNVSFGNYLSSLDDKARRIWNDNVELAERQRVPHTVGIDMPNWIVPSTLYDRRLSVEAMMAKKAQCPLSTRMLHIKNGKIHPCDLANAVYSIGVADYPGDYVDIEGSGSAPVLRQRIRDFIDAPYYRTCGHCAGSGTNAGRAAEQGFYDFLTPPTED